MGIPFQDAAEAFSFKIFRWRCCEWPGRPAAIRTSSSTHLRFVWRTVACPIRRSNGSRGPSTWAGPTSRRDHASRVKEEMRAANARDRGAGGSASDAHHSKTSCLGLRTRPTWRRRLPEGCRCSHRKVSPRTATYGGAVRSDERGGGDGPFARGLRWIRLAALRCGW